MRPRELRRRFVAGARRRRTGFPERLLELAIPGESRTVLAREGTSDIAAYHEVFRGGAYQFAVHQEPHTILDVGANVGYASVDFALRYPGARIVAVEPHPTNVALLRQNVQGLPVTVVEAAVWSRSGTVGLDDPSKGWWGFRALEDGDDVQAVTMEDLFVMFDGAVNIVKLDVEGSEVEVLTSNTDWLNEIEVLAIELHDRYRPGCRAALEKAIARSTSKFVESTRGATVVLTRIAVG